MLKKFGFILLAIAVVYLLFCVFAYFFPEYFFYKPSKERANLEHARANGYEAKEVVYSAADGTELYGWYTEPVSKNYTIVFMHGNSHNIEKFYYKLKPFVEAGYGTFIGEYRGFGGIKGKISQNSVEQDALAAVNYLKSIGYDNDNIILYGMSLGSHAALFAADNIKQSEDEPDVAAVILEVPFDSIYEVAKEKVHFPLPLNLIIKDKYDSVELVKKLHAPLMINIATHDETVPAAHGRKLFEAAPEPKIMIEYDKAAHTNLYDHKNYETLLKWLN